MVSVCMCVGSCRPERLTSEDFAEVLVDLEPIGQDTEHEEEDGEAEEHEARHDGRRVPNLSRLFADEAVKRKASEGEGRKRRYEGAQA